jgi:hypothetical protein
LTPRHGPTGAAIIIAVCSGGAIRSDERAAFAILSVAARIRRKTIARTC